MAYSYAKIRQLGADAGVTLGLVAIVIFLTLATLASYQNIRALNQGTAQVTHTHDVLIQLYDILSLVKDAETGQRGFVMTGRERYLEPYINAVNHIQDDLTSLGLLTRDNPAQNERIKILRQHIDAKLNELADTIELRRTQGFTAAMQMVETDRGRADMDALRAQIQIMKEEETRLRAERFEHRNEAYYTAMISGILSGILGVLLSGAVGYFVVKTSSMRRRQEWISSGELGLATVMSGEHRVEQLGERVLKFLAEYFDAQAGVFYARGEGGYRRAGAYGLPAGASAPESFLPGDGLLGQAARDRSTFIVRDVPDGYLTVGSALGRSKPRHLLIASAATEEHVNVVIELGFMHPVPDLATELLSRVSESIGIAVRSANYRASLQNLLEETQRQTEELQAQGEELRVSNEELEEQSRALRESQSRLEMQQVELEQTNSQLEEQTQQLETQRDELTRAQHQAAQKAQELEQASRYKSDFLANMSHELRTPLNSSLILAKLLADNPDGNLSAEQVKYAQTIQASGDDLLTLINDILDLSKIEAGHMEINPATVSMARLAEDLSRVFEPVAQEKDIRFAVRLMPGCPEEIATDRLRLEQILKNLLSNGLKFTEKGSVSLEIRCDGGGHVAFAVRDTGIGISDEQQRTVFEAFRQADSTISRKYGGTGLGLSISRQLARLLGGHILLESALGEGSTFTLYLPKTYSAESVRPQDAVPALLSSSPSSSLSRDESPPAPHRAIDDDRDKLTKGRRSILVIEDDESFARILYDIAREQGFQCLIAATADDALLLVRQYAPSAVVLDVGLPDHSGLSVLDRLKREPQTRHIPVHVISAGDYAQKALSLGAVGYMLKPVKRDELTEALQKLETRLEHHMRRVLIVEDDKVQRESLGKLLGSGAVETVGVATAAECLEKLKESTFDCMVLDLSLPDASGYSLLETLSQEEAYSFPPVIVYTGRDLSTDEEQRLRRYSRSIIIKGAKSPERLLDEVTLFLHQVVTELPAEQQRMLVTAGNRDAVLEGRRILVVEDDVRNVYSLTNVLEPRGAIVEIARNGKEALQALKAAGKGAAIDLVLMDVMMPEMDGITATREIRKNPAWKKLPIIMLTAKAMKDDQERCLESGANDYMAKPLDVDKLLSLVRVWMPR